MSINTFDAARWAQHVPTGGNYGDHTPTRSGAVLMDGVCFVRVAVPDVERVMHRLISSVKEHTGAAVVRLADLEAYTLRNGSDVLKARFAYSHPQQ